jgi:hypothetical protein
MRASCATVKTAGTARGGSWTVDYAVLFTPLAAASCRSMLTERWQRAVGRPLLGPEFPHHGCQWWRAAAAALSAGKRGRPHAPVCGRPMSYRGYHTSPVVYPSGQRTPEVRSPTSQVHQATRHVRYETLSLYLHWLMVV